MPDAMSWLGMRIDDAYGARVGDVQDVYLESDGSPRWIFTRPCRVLIPATDAMAGSGRVWVPYERELIKGAPAVGSLEFMTPELEAATWRWYAAGADHSGWVAHGQVPWVRGFDAEAARRRREEVRQAQAEAAYAPQQPDAPYGEQPPYAPPPPSYTATAPPPPQPRPLRVPNHHEALPPLQAVPEPPAYAPPPPAAHSDGRQVVMVFNIGCDDGARSSPARPADDGWDEAAQRALAEYARRTGAAR